MGPWPDSCKRVPEPFQGDNHVFLVSFSLVMSS